MSVAEGVVAGGITAAELAAFMAYLKRQNVLNTVQFPGNRRIDSPSVVPPGFGNRATTLTQDAVRPFMNTAMPITSPDMAMRVLMNPRSGQMPGKTEMPSGGYRPDPVLRSEGELTNPEDISKALRGIDKVKWNTVLPKGLEYSSVSDDLVNPSEEVRAREIERMGLVRRLNIAKKEAEATNTDAARKDVEVAQNELNTFLAQRPRNVVASVKINSPSHELAQQEKASEQFLNIEAGHQIRRYDEVPEDALKVINAQLYQLGKKPVPADKDGRINGINLAKYLAEMGVDKEVLEASRDSLYKLGYRRFGNKEITASGFKDIDAPVRTCSSPHR